MEMIPIRYNDKYNNKNKKDKIYIMQIGLKTRELLDEVAFFQDLGESEIIAGNKKLSKLDIENVSNKYEMITDFIRKNSTDKYIVTTKASEGSNVDAYVIKTPKKYVNKSFDKLYGVCVMDIMKSESSFEKKKGNPERKRIISLKDIGILEEFDYSELRELINISSFTNFKKTEKFAYISSIFDFLDNFDFKFNSVFEDMATFKEQLKFFKNCSSDLYNKQLKLLEKAEKNAEVYNKLSFIHYHVFREPLKLVNNDKQKEKRKIKVGD